MSNEKIFASGFTFKRQENAPDWVVGSLSCKVQDAIVFLKNHMKQDGWVNMAIKTSQAGKPYIELDTWEPKKQEAPNPQPQTTSAETDDSFEDDEDDLPF